MTKKLRRGSYTASADALMPCAASNAPGASKTCRARCQRRRVARRELTTPLWRVSRPRQLRLAVGLLDLLAARRGPARLDTYQESTRCDFPRAGGRSRRFTIGVGGFFPSADISHF
jgi:hypothetical protein